MSANPEVEEVEEVLALPVAEPPLQVQEAAAQVVKPAGRGRPTWMASASVGAVALIAVGALGCDAYAASRQRDGLDQRLVVSTSTLASARSELATAQAEARSNKVTADYVALYVADEGKVLTDYETVVNCNSYSTCRTAAQQMLEDMQAFQSDRKLANVPSGLSASDSSLGDALSAAIAGDQEFIDGMDSDSVAKIKDGGHKIDAAMLSIAKAESALGTGLK